MQSLYTAASGGSVLYLLSLIQTQHRLNVEVVPLWASANQRAGNCGIFINLFSFCLFCRSIVFFPCEPASSGTGRPWGSRVSLRIHSPLNPPGVHQFLMVPSETCDKQGGRNWSWIIPGADSTLAAELRPPEHIRTHIKNVFHGRKAWRRQSRQLGRWLLSTCGSSFHSSVVECYLPSCVGPRPPNRPRPLRLPPRMPLAARKQSHACCPSLAPSLNKLTSFSVDYTQTLIAASDGQRRRRWSRRNCPLIWVMKRRQWGRSAATEGRGQQRGCGSLLGRQQCYHPGLYRPQNQHLMVSFTRLKAASDDLISPRSQLGAGLNRPYIFLQLVNVAHVRLVQTWLNRCIVD